MNVASAHLEFCRAVFHDKPWHILNIFDILQQSCNTPCAGFGTRVNAQQLKQLSSVIITYVLMDWPLLEIRLNDVAANVAAEKYARGQPSSTTMAFATLLRRLMKQGDFGKRRAAQTCEGVDARASVSTEFSSPDLQR